MPPFKVSESELMNALLEVFRREGFEGASMSIISQYTGLKRSSLYHRFPGGKQQMAEEVLAYTGTWMQEHVIKPLEGPLPPIDRLRLALDQISALYGGGKKVCLLRSLAMGTSSQAFQLGVQSRFEEWIQAFVEFGKSVGLSDSQANALARSTVIQIQGSLVLAQAMKDPSIFQKSIDQIEQTYKQHIS